jgi:hypothetical protein
MSKEAIQAVVDELKSLPETDQRLVLEFLANLRGRRHAANPGPSSSERQAALVVKDGLLVFTGQLDAPGTDWVRLVRAERDKDLMRSSQDWTARP